jgi:hypothetical protein
MLRNHTINRHGNLKGEEHFFHLFKNYMYKAWKSLSLILILFSPLTLHKKHLYHGDYEYNHKKKLSKDFTRSDELLKWTYICHFTL